MLDLPLKGEALFSQNYGSFGPERPSQYLTVLSSPIELKLSERLVENMASAYSELMMKFPATSEADCKHRRSILRLAVCAKLRRLKLKFQIRSLRVALEQGSPPIYGAGGSFIEMRKIALQEILVDLLSLLVCFPPPFSNTAASEAINIARGRISSIGVSSDCVEKCLVFVVDRFIQSIGAMEAATRSSKEVSSSVGLSPGIHFSKDECAKSKESDKIMDCLIKNTVFEAVEYSLNLEPMGLIEWSNSLILDLPVGLVVDAERFSYDWNISGRIDSFSIRNGGGRNLVSISTSSAPVLQNAASRSGLLFAINEHEAGYELGGGGLNMPDLSHDHLIQDHMDRRGYRIRLCQSVQATVGFFDLHFSDLDFTNAIEALSMLSHSFGADNKDDSGSPVYDEESIVESISASVDFEKVQVLLCTDGFQPFAKALLHDLSLDIVSSDAIRDEMKKLQVVAKSDIIFLYDLSPEGQIYEKVIESESATSNSDCAFEMRMTISDDTIQIPSELLILLTGVRVVFLRRFLTELVSSQTCPTHEL
jgi:hypothetical protein